MTPHGSRTWRRAARLFAMTLAVASASVATAQPASADEVNVRLYTATFNGFGKVVTPDAGKPTVTVTSYNPSIFDDECTAVVAAGVAAPEVVRCTFNYSATFDPVAGVYCTGVAVASGRLVVFLPTGGHTFEFTDMRAVVDEATVHGFGTSYVDPGTGQIRTGYAEFDFGGTKCDKRVPNIGRALY